MNFESEEEEFQFYKNKLQQNVKEYLSIDDEIKALNKAVLERKKKKKDLSEFILECMKKIEINHINVTGGKLSYSISKNKSPLNKQNITDSLSKYFNDEQKAVEICKHILDTREKVERIRLKRTNNKTKLN